MVLLELFSLVWLCGWFVGQYLASQVLQALIFCGNPDCQASRMLEDRGGLVGQLVADKTLDRTFAVPFLAGWLAAWSCGGLSMWQTLLGNRGSLARVGPALITWAVMMMAFQRNSPMLRATECCSCPGGWLLCWLLLPVLFVVLPYSRGRWRNGGSSRQMVYLPCEVLPRSTSSFRAASHEISRPSEDSIRRAAADLGFMSGDLAVCAICFSPLCSEPCAVLSFRNGRRTCGHYFHLRCTRRMATSSTLAWQPPTCPLCRQPYSAWMPIPDIAKQPRAWFEVVDTDGDSKLSETEVVEACAMLLPVERERVRVHLHRGSPSLWQQWDEASSACVAWDAFRGPSGSLISWLLAAREASKVRDALDEAEVPV